MPKRVNRIVVSHRQVAQHGAPKVNVHIITPGCNRNLYLLHSRTIRVCIVFPCNSRDGSRKLNVLSLQLPQIAR